jgi:hypothetical protein
MSDEQIRAHGFEPGQIVSTFDVRGESVARVVGATEYRLLVEYPSGRKSNWVAEKLSPATPADVATFHGQRWVRRLLDRVSGAPPSGE